MPEFDFTLALRGGLNPDKLDALFKAGCDDVTFQGNESGPAYAEVTRDSLSFLEAALSAIHDIETVSGLVVEAIDGGELVTAAEIADRLGRTRESVRLLISGQRGPGEFPAPRLRLRDRTKLWLWSDVGLWANEHLGTSIEVGFGPEAVTLNAALALRRGEAQIGVKARTAIHELVGV
jgi:hypothetical protein